MCALEYLSCLQVFGCPSATPGGGLRWRDVVCGGSSGSGSGREEVVGVCMSVFGVFIIPVTIASEPFWNAGRISSWSLNCIRRISASLLRQERPLLRIVADVNAINVERFVNLSSRFFRYVFGFPTVCCRTSAALQRWGFGTCCRSPRIFATVRRRSVIRLVTSVRIVR